MSAKYIVLICILFFILSASPAYSENYTITLNCSDILDATIDKTLRVQHVPNGMETVEFVYYITYRLAHGSDKKLYDDYNAHKEFNRYIYIEDHLILVMAPVSVDIPYANKIGESFSFSSAEKAASHIQNVCPGTAVHIK